MNGTFEIFAIILMVGLTVWVFLRMTRRSPKKVKDTLATRQERAVWAWARVVNASHGTPGLGGMVRVSLELEVHLPGTPPYTANATWLVEESALEYVETGKEISLRADPKAPEYIFPHGSWAQVVDRK